MCAKSRNGSIPGNSLAPLTVFETNKRGLIAKADLIDALWKAERNLDDDTPREQKMAGLVREFLTFDVH